MCATQCLVLGSLLLPKLSFDFLAEAPAAADGSVSKATSTEATEPAAAEAPPAEEDATPPPAAAAAAAPKPAAAAAPRAAPARPAVAARPVPARPVGAAAPKPAPAAATADGAAAGMWGFVVEVSVDIAQGNRCSDVALDFHFIFMGRL